MIPSMRKGRHLLLLLPLSFSYPIGTTSIDVHVGTVRKCKLCGDYGPESTPFPNKPLPDIKLPVGTCLEIEKASPFIEPDTQACNSIQAFGTYCGCNKPPNACTLCWDGSQATNKNFTLVDYPASMFVDTLGFDQNLNCESLEALLHSTRSKDTDQCDSVQLGAGERCGCPPIPVQLTQTNNNNNTDTLTTDNIFSTSTEGEEERKSCTICENGDPPPFPHKVVDLGNDQKLTCTEWDNLAGTLEEGSGDCALVRSGASRICQCPRPAGQCTMCPLGEPIPYPRRNLNWLSGSFLSSDRDYYLPSGVDYLNCELMESYVTSEYSLFPQIFGVEEELLCTAMQMKSWICGCQPDWRQIVLTWSYRLSGAFSLLGSSLIIVCILRKRQTKFTTYHQLVLGISVFDSVSSTAYMLVGVMAPYEAGFYLSRGNDTTCKIQGFMIQLGQTASMFYNLCLSLYYFLVIVHSWREKFLRKILVVAHIFVVSTALGMSVGAIPYIEAQFGVCGILPPLTASQWQISLFYTVPVSIVLIGLTVLTISICCRVYSQNARVRRWRTDVRTSVTRRVFWQSVWYVSAFYVTLPFVLLSFYVKFKSSRYFWIYIVTAILAPLQGVMNALIYFQRSKDFQAYWSRESCCRRTRKPNRIEVGRRCSTDSSKSVSNQVHPALSVASVEAAQNDNNNDDDDEEGAVYCSSSDAHDEETRNSVEKAIECAVTNSDYIQDECFDDDYETDDDSNELGMQAADNDPLAPPGSVDLSGDLFASRWEDNMARLREMGPQGQRESSLQNFLFRTKLNAMLVEQEQADIGGVLEYWMLHEGDSSVTTGTISRRGSTSSLRFGRH